MKKICSRCKTEKEEIEFPVNGGRRHSWCKKCHREVVNEKYFQNREWVNSFKKKCEICGYDKNKSALEFHHVDKNKEFGINQLARRALTNKQKIIDEMEKCIVICANCHRELHNPQLNKSK